MAKKKITVYFDNCLLNRPLDDQAQERIFDDQLLKVAKSGNYTKDRQKYFRKMTLEQLVADIKREYNKEE